jgi:hypothetical protein
MVDVFALGQMSCHTESPSGRRRPTRAARSGWDAAAMLLGAGVRLFDHLANTPVVLGNPTVVTGAGVTHLRYPVHTS